VVAAIIAVRAAAESGATGSQFSDLLDSGFHALLIALPILFGLVVPLGWGRLAAGFEHYRYRHARWLDPAVLSDESVGPRARLKHAASDPQRWWNRSLVGSRGRMAVVVMLLATVPVGAGIWFLAGFPNPFDAERSWGIRAAISGGAVALGLGAELVTFVVVGLIALTVGGLYGTWHAYRRWVYATNTPPPS
jgi:hypothetical protein